jgi:hypothetical protein
MTSGPSLSEDAEQWEQTLGALDRMGGNVGVDFFLIKGSEFPATDVELDWMLCLQFLSISLYHHPFGRSSTATGFKNL